jgi:hypothetical protein
VDECGVQGWVRVESEGGPTRGDISSYKKPCHRLDGDVTFEVEKVVKSQRSKGSPADELASERGGGQLGWNQERGDLVSLSSDLAFCAAYPLSNPRSTDWKKDQVNQAFLYAKSFGNQLLLFTNRDGQARQ